MHNKKLNLSEKLSIEFLLSIQNKGGLIKEKKRIYFLLLDSRPFLYLIKYYI